jgi:hypothetical protein
MATATKTARPTKKSTEKSTLDYLQRALDDLDKARAHAQTDARTNIDAAVGRIRDAAQDLRSRASDEAREFEQRLESVSEDARRELGRMVIHAQRSPEALSELSSEIRRRKQALNA